ncbi:hypothetical protein [Embleya scabrispora]|uniref:hypothetical protein n=1 Tax=Embleya scabrispora TaxID=159449 RepID=UPI00037A30CC|nr:hypothetical protein [Embleya scabrispora]
MDRTARTDHGCGRRTRADPDRVRTPTRRQELASQIEALEKAGCSKIFREQISTRIKVRPELDKARNSPTGSRRPLPTRT